jgi:DNA-binding beta-propeller fold protein YncE
MNRDAKNTRNTRNTDAVEKGNDSHRSRSCSSYSVFLVFLPLVCLCAMVLPAQPLRLETTIPLPNVNGRIDHLSADVAGKRLFVSALGNNSVEVVDLSSGKILHSIRGLKEPQGVFFWPEMNRLYVANGVDGHVRVYDGRSFEPIHEYDLSGDADNIRFDPAAKEVFVGYGSGALGVLNVELKSNAGETMLDEHPEGFQLEKQGPRVFINVPKAENVTVIDRRTRSVKAKWPVTGAKLNYPMALDEVNRRLFIGCRKPAKMLVLDTADGKEIANIDITGDTDDLFYDASLKRIYVSGGAGSISVIEQKDADHYNVIATIPTAEGARTSLLVPELKRLYVARPHRGKQAAGLMVFAVSE